MTKAQFEAEGVDDLVLLPKVNEQGIVENLYKRYMNDKIYTNIGPVLISVNPFRHIPGICDIEQVADFKGRFRHEVPPNIFALAEDCYRKMKNEQENQCVIITGESGAGKTEAAKLIMKYISAVSGSAAEIAYVKDVIMDSNPLLEAFGNAKTLRNNNSSRFGKYFEIQFNRLGDPCGGKISHYLLEKSRVVGRLKGERNFHIFYQLLRGANAQEKTDFTLWDPQYYRFLSNSDCYDVDHMDDSKEWADVRKALNTLGFSGDDQYYILRLVAAILHFGNLVFGEDDKEQATFPHGEDALLYAAQLFDVEASVLKQAITFRTVNTKGSTYNVPNNALNAAGARDAMVKEVYARIFDFLIDKTNTALNKYGAQFSVVIGVLDIYGFEIFDKNGFEQFCINYVNEKLQQFFIELTLKAEQEEYQKEGIKWEPIKFFNNKIVCELIEGKKPPGIFSLLDDVCASMHAVGASGGIDVKFLDKCTMFCSDNMHFYRKGTGFSVKHYAGEVTYESDGFCEKNKDIVYQDIIQAIQTSANPFLVARFPEDVSSAQSKRPTTSGFKIRNSAGELMKTLSACTPHYIRCIKPNDTKKPKDWDEKRVSHQVQYLGLLENVRVRRAGFAYRAEFARFLARYKKLNNKTWGSWGEWTGDTKEGCRIILSESGLDQTQWQIGASKVFIRHPESLFYLEESLERHDYEAASLIQKLWRKFVAQKHSLEQRAQAANILKGKKDRRQESMSPNFQGDYSNYDQNYGLQTALGPHKEERVVFADQVMRLNRRLRVERRDFMVSVEAVYLVMRASKLGQNFYKMTRRTPLSQIQSVSLSTLQDNFVVIHCAPTDIVIECSHKTEMLAVMLEYTEKATGRKFNLNFTDNITFNVENNDTRVMNFRQDSSQRVRLKKKGKNVEVGICAGIGKDADTAPKGVARPVGGGASRPMGGASPAAAAGRGQPIASTPAPAPVPAPTPVARPTPAVASKPTAKAMYDYSGQSQDELSFKEGDIITILKKDPGGWWEGELRGQRGWIPANYVQEN
eukprot:TRINITY_DN2724_c0_g1_i1.p1 TRINITY_DN2724_c0_g1~~TRINITY_DN2724_c0_g1_i1.p1  ORF type:complete len:1027 (-),score=294.17 TRINITY_DN2724_c0_g1_i1:177-3257(-)